MTMRFASASSPACRGLKRVAMGNAFHAFGGRMSEIGQAGLEGGDGLLVALVENPLADAPRRHEVGRRQRRQMRRDAGLRQAAIVELAGADTHLERMRLGG